MDLTFRKHNGLVIVTPDDDSDLGLRDRKKLATRDAISAAALRLALQHGPDNVRVNDIAEAAGVSPRTSRTPCRRSASPSPPTGPCASARPYERGRRTSRWRRR
jgi:hypothetical protein